MVRFCQITLLFPVLRLRTMQTLQHGSGRHEHVKRSINVFSAAQQLTLTKLQLSQPPIHPDSIATTEPDSPVCLFRLAIVVQGLNGVRSARCCAESRNSTEQFVNLSRVNWHLIRPLRIL